MVRKQSGFTLIELMLVVAVIAILAAVAFPSYQEHVRKTKRTEVQAELIDIASRLQQYKSTNFNYKINATTAIDLTKLGFSSATPLSQNGLYTLNLSFNPAATSWVLSAVPSPTGNQKNDGVSCLDDTGQRYWSKVTATASACGSALAANSNWDGR
ncbi:type IV pilin protein [Acinetobacter variabilis]|uniref:type IV pilin protein n=1 Tax=Acinetobacter variabilis TaxID=70346 RepID=UPI0028964B70|nr:type IV pilin protein [Acinetobacter variabilis]